jgi:NADH dehydrogenase
MQFQNPNNLTEKRIVIIGGGFAGVETARNLSQTLPEDWKIVLFSQSGLFVLTPLLSEVIGSYLNAKNIVKPICEMVKNIDCRALAVNGIDLTAGEVLYNDETGRSQRLSYRHLAIAVGVDVDMTLIPGMAEHSLPFKTPEDATRLKNLIVKKLETAGQELDARKRARLLSFVILGGGFAGVEVAGAITDFLYESCRFYSYIDPEEIRVTIIEQGQNILAPLPKRLADLAEKNMKDANIHILANSTIEAVTPRGVQLKGRGLIQASAVISTIGAKICPLLNRTNLPFIRNRIKTFSDMRVEGYDNVWALGDCAAVPNAYDNSISPMLAQIATRQAKVLAKNIVNALNGQPTVPFSFKPQGIFANIGNFNAVGNSLWLPLSGWPAFLLWRGFYLMKMPSLSAKLQLGWDWLFNSVVPPELDAQPKESFWSRKKKDAK